MKKHIVAALALAAVFSAGAFASDSEEQQAQYMETCENYAKEDGVSAEEKAVYIEQCVADLASAAAESAASEGGSDKE